MPEGQCPHCEATLELPANKADVFTCLSCGQQFGWLPDEGEGMEAEIVALVPDPRKDEPDAYERKVLFVFKLLGGLVGLTVIALLAAFILLMLFLFELGRALSEVSV